VCGAQRVSRFATGISQSAASLECPALPRTISIACAREVQALASALLKQTLHRALLTARGPRPALGFYPVRIENSADCVAINRQRCQPFCCLLNRRVLRSHTNRTQSNAHPPPGGIRVRRSAPPCAVSVVPTNNRCAQDAPDPGDKPARSASILAAVVNPPIPCRTVFATNTPATQHRPSVLGGQQNLPYPAVGMFPSRASSKIAGMSRRAAHRRQAPHHITEYRRQT